MRAWRFGRPLCGLSTFVDYHPGLKLAAGLHHVRRGFVRTPRMLALRRVGLRYSTRLLRREFSAPASPGGGIGLKTAAAGMVGTAGLGIGIGMLLPSVLFGDKEKPEDLQQQDLTIQSHFENYNHVAMVFLAPAR